MADGNEDKTIRLERHSLVPEKREKKRYKFMLGRRPSVQGMGRKKRKKLFSQVDIEGGDSPFSMAELNLDYLEGGRFCSPCSPNSLPQLSPDTPELVKLVLIGAPGVGKTSIVQVQQFVWNSFVKDYVPTDSRHTYYPTVIVNGRVYELKITDLPAVPYFPVSSVYELQDCPLRDATAYMMVLDLSDLDTFRYLETVREQIMESRESRSLPGLVVGNKVDLLDTHDDVILDRRRQVMDRVTLWGCEYTECSARYSSLVCHVFRRLMEAVDRETNAAASHACPMDAFTGSKCSIL